MIADIPNDATEWVEKLGWETSRWRKEMLLSLRWTESRDHAMSELKPATDNAICSTPTLVTLNGMKA